MPTPGPEPSSHRFKALDSALEERCQDATAPPGGARRFFIIAEYRDQGSELLEPSGPLVAPCGEEGDGACVVVRHSWRERKTGPCFPLLVVRCLSHGRSFSVYPPGHVPYGRRAIARVGFDGSAVRDEPDSKEELARTLFEAAEDAAAGIAWGREASGGGSRSTQSRQMEKAARLLGIAAGGTSVDPAVQAEVLAVDTLLLLEQRAKLLGRPGYVERGAALMKVLLSVEKGPCLVDRLAEAGFRAGLWGRPTRWDAEARVLRSMPFRRTGTRPGAGAPSG